MRIYEGSQIKELDSLAAAAEGITTFALMQRAGAALAERLTALCNNGQTFILVAGRGNNGGDAWVVALELFKRGAKFELYVDQAYRPTDDTTAKRPSPDALLAQQALHEHLNNCDDEEVRGHVIASIHFFDDRSYITKLKNRYETLVIVDGLIGTGFHGTLRGEYADIVKQINRLRRPVISIDIPSGLPSEGVAEEPSAVIRANSTITLHARKLSFFWPENQRHVGTIHLESIGISEFILNEAYFEDHDEENTKLPYLVDTPYHCTELGSIRSMLKQRDPFAHKGTFGHGLLVAGSRGMYGAAILAAEGAMRSGLGLLSVHSDEALMPILATRLPETMMCTSLPEIDCYKAIAIGPGNGTQDLRHILDSRQSEQPLILDAGALNALAADETLLDALRGEVLLTPHPKEFDRLFGIHATTYDRHLTARREAQARQLYIILKGRYSALYTPTGEVHFNMTGTPGLATAGSGDTLTGILLGLATQGYTMEETALIGISLHTTAGNIAAQRHSEEAMIASDISTALGTAFQLIRKVDIFAEINGLEKIFDTIEYEDNYFRHKTEFTLR